MEKVTKLIIALNSIEIVGNKIINIIEEIGENAELEDVLSCKSVKLTQFERESINKFDYNEFDNILEKMQNKNINVITYLDDEFPKRLLNIDDRAAILYYIGDLSLLSSNCFAIVGSRKTDSYGELISARFAKALASAGLTIVSGLAMGVDGIAHKNTLDVNGKTIAVMAGGLFNIYPACNIDLARQIAREGLLISEYFPTHRPTNYTFPYRNRIIAGLSSGVLITQASVNSGTRHTKEYAIENNIPVFAIPGDITRKNSELANATIVNGEGIGVTDPQMILDYFGLAGEKSKKVELDGDEKLVYKVLQCGELDFDTLIEKSKLSVQKLNVALTMLEVKGIVKRFIGNRYALC